MKKLSGAQKLVFGGFCTVFFGSIALAIAGVVLESTQMVVVGGVLFIFLMLVISFLPD